MPAWLTTLISIAQELPEIIALIEKVVGHVAHAPDKKAAVEAVDKAVSDLHKE